MCFMTVDSKNQNLSALFEWMAKQRFSKVISTTSISWATLVKVPSTSTLYMNLPNLTTTVATVGSCFHKLIHITAVFVVI